MSRGAPCAVVRAVQYVRMSTDHQRYSIDRQKSVIAEYANARGFEIVRTYADPGKSGLSLKGRDALRALLSDALKPERDFEAILVHDISRWGRFQDPDQAAHYEFICRQAGLSVAYCAEPFENDQSAIASIMKNLKRVMAHEFSRELSDKLSRAHLQQAELGFKQGGTMIYGFRRLLVDDTGRPRFILKPGQVKALRTDRVRYALGSEAEQEVIKAIFRLYNTGNHSLRSIAEQLNMGGTPGNGGSLWRARTVRAVLGSELCVGRYVYNKRSQKLQTLPVKNPEKLWIRTSAQIASVVDEETFAQAQDQLRRRKPTKLDKQQMLEDLRALLKEKRRLSPALVNAAPHVPSATTYKKHFGSFTEACRLAGYVKPICVSGAERAWSMEDMRVMLRQLYDEHGYLSDELIEKDTGLPSLGTIKKKVGRMAAVYDLIGAPRKTQSEIIKEAMARRTERMKTNPGPRRPHRFHWSHEELVAGLKDLLKRNGYLSAPLIKADDRLPSVTTIIERFGSVLNAYRAAGWKVSKSTLAELRQMRRFGPSSRQRDS